MSELITLDELLTILKIPVQSVDVDVSHREVLIPADVVEQIKNETPEKQTMILKGLLRLQYDPTLADAKQRAEGVYSIDVRK